MKALRDKWSLAGLLVASIALSCAANPAERYPVLVMHGESHANSCHPVEVDKLRKILLMSKVKNVEQLWYAITVLLCSPGNGSDLAYIAGMFPAKIRERAEATGADPTISTVHRGSVVVDEVMAKGHAWNATLLDERKKVILQYFKDEACVHGVDFVFVDGRWVISEIGRACD